MSTTTDTSDPRIEERTRELAVAHEQQELARLRREAATAIAGEDAEATRMRHLEQLVAEFPDRLKGAGTEKAEKHMIAAIDAYIAASRQRSDVLSEAYDLLSRAAAQSPLPEGMGFLPGSGTVAVGGQSYP